MKELKIILKKLNEVKELATIHRLYILPKEESVMYHTLNNLPKLCEKINVLLLYWNDILLGWLWFENKWPYNGYEVNIFIREKYRRRGFGTYLFNEAKKLIKEKRGVIVVSMEDKLSEKFYNTVLNIT